MKSNIVMSHTRANAPNGKCLFSTASAFAAFLPLQTLSFGYQVDLPADDDPLADCLNVSLEDTGLLPLL